MVGDTEVLTNRVAERLPWWVTRIGFGAQLFAHCDLRTTRVMLYRVRAENVKIANSISET